MMNLSTFRSWVMALPLLLMGRAGFAQDDAISKFFNKYVDDDRFSVVTISPRMFQLLAKVDWDTVAPDVKQTVSKLTSLRILSTSATPMQFYREALAKIDRKEYEELLTVRSNKDDAHFLIRSAGNKVLELVMVAASDDSFTLLCFEGDIDLKALSRLSGDIGIKGMESLKNAKRP